MFQYKPQDTDYIDVANMTHEVTSTKLHSTCTLCTGAFSPHVPSLSPSGSAPLSGPLHQTHQTDDHLSIVPASADRRPREGQQFPKNFLLTNPITIPDLANYTMEQQTPQEFILEAFADPASVRDVVRGIKPHSSNHMPRDRHRCCRLSTYHHHSLVHPSIHPPSSTKLNPHIPHPPLRSPHRSAYL